MSTTSTKPNTRENQKRLDTNSKPASEVFANIGEVVTLNSGQKCTVKELPLRQILALGPRLASIATVLMDEVKSGDLEQSSDGKNIELFLTLASNPDIFDTLVELASSSTGLTTEELNELGTSEWAGLLLAFKKVTNWEQLKSAFSQLIPPSVKERINQSRTKGQVESEDS